MRQKKVMTVKINGCWYKIGRELGAGSYGVVCEATRVHDDLKVALKIVEKTEDVIQSYIKIPGYPELVPLEIGLHMLATTGENVPVIVKLLDWMDNYGYIYIILESPSPCEDVLSFVDRHGGITENMAKVILRQAIEASEICFKRGVYHRDLKLNNFLINPNTMEVKLIDFGAGRIYKTSTYKEFQGTEDVCPEYLKTDWYYGKPSAVYSMGFMLLSMVCGHYPSTTDLHQINEKTWSKDGLTEECCDLIQACMQLNPDERIHLEKILDHAWFKVLCKCGFLNLFLFQLFCFLLLVFSQILKLASQYHVFRQDLHYCLFQDKDPADGLQTPIYSGSDDVIQYPDDAGSDGSDDGEVQIPPLPLISVSHERLDDDEDPNVTTESEFTSIIST
ncbi:putative serine/threonine-protein kinase pim-3 [Triplophysa rosa]|uniref:non-specific serine/threonine protein kinase n=1 Tax=Triplophysa rosa TaxID=992332 RepID=A0A9W7WS41_TRIRA|nr:putative serine/threonine-protein kinase pim-3 [Triplophysa rosa]